MHNLTEAQILELATTTPLSYDQVASLADKAERYGIDAESLRKIILTAWSMRSAIFSDYCLASLLLSHVHRVKCNQEAQ